MAWLKRLYTWLIYGFFYFPLLVMFLYSFNTNKYTTEWGGFSLKWYSSLFQNTAILDAAINSL
ncbi:MAG: spermidine/putrescine ABC transporter permease PotC, partial [Deltaproteobacteria bacterium]|nr:spermidine/putrescine ABC transporter permease PotC [Deltaproteobacteria bacterium]